MSQLVIKQHRAPPPPATLQTMIYSSSVLHYMKKVCFLVFLLESTAGLSSVLFWHPGVAKWQRIKPLPFTILICLFIQGKGLFCNSTFRGPMESRVTYLLKTHGHFLNNLIHSQVMCNVIWIHMITVKSNTVNVINLILKKSEFHQ